MFVNSPTFSPKEQPIVVRKDMKRELQAQQVQGREDDLGDSEAGKNK
jgi:hypothetical protein